MEKRKQTVEKDEPSKSSKRENIHQKDAVEKLDTGKKMEKRKQTVEKAEPSKSSKRENVHQKDAVEKLDMGNKVEKRKQTVEKDEPSKRLKGEEVRPKNVEVPSKRENFQEKILKRKVRKEKDSINGEGKDKGLNKDEKRLPS